MPRLFFAGLLLAPLLVLAIALAFIHSSVEPAPLVEATPSPQQRARVTLHKDLGTALNRSSIPA